MKVFKRVKTVDEIIDQCVEQDVPIDISGVVNGWDHIVIGAAPYCVVFNTASGRFFGEVPDVGYFTSDDEDHDDQSWFQQLLEFFLSNK